MRRHRAGAWAAALAAVVAGPAWAAQPSQPFSHVATTAAHAPLTAAAVLQRQIGSLARMGVRHALLASVAQAAGLDDGGSVVISGGNAAEPPAYLDIAGRMAGHDVVLETRYPYVEGHPELLLTARAAATGQKLWTRSERLSDTSLEVPLFALTGRHPTAGLVLVRVDIAKTTAGGGGLQVTLTLTGCSGAGTTLWRHRETGRLDGSGETEMPSLTGDFSLGPDARPDALLLDRESATSDSSGNETFTVTTLRLSTTTGTMSGLGAPVHSSVGEPYPLTVADLSGDHYSDFVMTVPGSEVTARSGRGGSTIWTNSTAATGAFSYGYTVGDVVASPAGHAAAPEVAVASGPPPPGLLESLPFSLPVADPTAPAHGTVTLLNGASGTTVWSKSGDDFFEVETAGAQHVPAVGVASATTTYDTTGYGTAAEQVTIAAYDSAGNQLFTHDYSVSTKGDGSGFSGGFGDAGQMGDWDSDGSLDGYVYAVVFDGGNESDASFPYRGVDGTPYPTTGTPLVASTTGHGGDFVVVTTKHGVTITVHRGRDMKVLFARRVPRTDGVTATNTYGEYVPGARRADVLSCGSGAKTGYCADLTPAGRIRWVVHYRPTRAPDGQRQAQPVQEAAGSSS